MADEKPAAPVQAGPQVAGQMSKEDVAKITQSFAGKCCPLGLVGVAIAGQQSPLVGPLGQPAKSGGDELVACQGPACMWFRIAKDQNGKVLFGDCVVNLAANAISSAPQMMGEVLVQLGKFRFTPNGG